MYKFIGIIFSNGTIIRQLLGDKVVCEQFVTDDALPEFEEILGQSGYTVEYVGK